MTPIELRISYAEAASSSGLANSLAKRIDKLPNDLKETPLYILYRSAVEALLGREALFPLTKLGHISKASEGLNKAVNAMPDKPEARAIRLSIEQGIPGYLNLSKHLDLDARFLVENFSLLDPQEMPVSLLAQMIEVFEKSGRFTPEEIATIRKGLL